MEESVLDFSSDSFDPLASIYSGEDVKLPDPNAPILDNVETFVARLNKPSTSSGKKSEKKSNKPLNPLGVERQFTQDQMPIQCAKKRPNNVLTWMEKQKQGPYQMAKNLNPLGVFKSPMHHASNHESTYKIPRNPTKSYEIQSNPNGSYEIPRDLTKSYDILSNPARSYEILGVKIPSE